MRVSITKNCKVKLMIEMMRDGLRENLPYIQVSGADETMCAMLQIDE